MEIYLVRAVYVGYVIYLRMLFKGLKGQRRD